jgi:hypothetical protein
MILGQMQPYLASKFGLKAEKRIPLNLGSQFATLGAKQQEPKMLKVGPKFVSALTPSVKWAYSSEVCDLRRLHPTQNLVHGIICYLFIHKTIHP